MIQYVKQHYVPRFYLKNFSLVDDANVVYCYDKAKNTSYNANVSDIGQEKLFYGVEGVVSDEVENSLSKVESRFFSKSYSELLRLKNYNKLSHDNKAWFSLFLAFQLVRTKETRLRVKELREKVVFELAKSELEAEKGITIPKNLTIKFTDPEYIKFLHVDMMWPELEIFYELGKFLFNKHWVILRNQTEMPLWTSDNPISFYNTYGEEGNLGIMSPGVEIRFPLSSRLLLFSFDPNTDPPFNNKDKMRTDMVQFANELQVRSSTRFIYSADSRFEAAAKYLESNPKFRNPKRPRWKVFVDKDKIETIGLE